LEVRWVPFRGSRDGPAARVFRRRRPPVEFNWCSSPSVASPLPLRWQRGFTIARLTCGSLAFPACPLDTHASPRCPGVPSQPGMSTGNRPGHALHHHCRSFGDTTESIRSARARRLGVPPAGPKTCWGEPRHRVRSDASLGVCQSPPLHRHHRARPLPGPALRRSPFGPGLPAPELVPPLPFFRLRRFAPRVGSQVCCALRPAMRFARLPGGSFRPVHLRDQRRGLRCLHRRPAAWPNHWNPTIARHACQRSSVAAAPLPAG